MLMDSAMAAATPSQSCSGCRSSRADKLLKMKNAPSFGRVFFFGCLRELKS
jgi:hypothetical protein